jgi:hypothetical protein
VAVVATNNCSNQDRGQHASAATALPLWASNIPLHSPLAAPPNPAAACVTATAMAAPAAMSSPNHPLPACAAAAAAGSTYAARSL